MKKKLLQFSSITILAFTTFAMIACSSLDPIIGGGGGGEGVQKIIDAGEFTLQLQKNEAQGSVETQNDIPVSTNVTASCNTQAWGQSEVRSLVDTVGLNLSGTNIYPGAILRGQSFEQGVFVPNTIPRAGGTITLTGLKLEPNATYSRTVDEVKFETIQQGMEDILSVDVQGTAANASYQTEQTYDYEHMLFSLGIDARYGPASVSGKLDIDSTKTRNYVFTKFTQVFYDVKFQDPELSTSVFRDGANFNDPEGQISAGNPPLYVSSVSYGRMVLFVAESSHDATEVKAALDAAVKGGPGTSVEVKSGLTHQEIMARTKVNYYVIGGNAGLALNPIDSATPEEMFTKVKEFIADRDAANYSASNPGVPIAYTMNYLKDRAPARMSYTVNYDQKDCEFTYSDPPPPEPVGAKVKISLERILINKDCDAGDGEFYGSLSINGSEVWSEPDDKDRHISLSQGASLNFDSTRNRTKEYRYGTSEKIRIQGFLNEDDGISGDDQAGSWNLSLDPFNYGSFSKFSNPSGANCESTLYYSIEKVREF